MKIVMMKIAIVPAMTKVPRMKINKRLKPVLKEIMSDGIARSPREVIGLFPKEACLQRSIDPTRVAKLLKSIGCIAKQSSEMGKTKLWMLPKGIIIA